MAGGGGGAWRVGLAAVLAGLSLAACATTPAPTPTPVEGGTPAPMTGYDWFLNEDGAASQLVFGVEDTDDVRLTVACERPNGALEVSAHGPRGGKAEIHLESGGETARLRAASEPSEIGDGDWLTVVANTTDPVFQMFRRVGWIALWQGGERHAFAPQPGSTGRIERFFSRCG